jgi:polyphosphate kinase
MERNFFRRVEVAFPIRSPEHMERILRDLDACLKDDCQAWKLLPNGDYERLSPGKPKAFSAQAELLAVYAAGALAAP